MCLGGKVIKRVTMKWEYGYKVVEYLGYGAGKSIFAGPHVSLDEGFFQKSNPVIYSAGTTMLPIKNTPGYYVYTKAGTAERIRDEAGDRAVLRVAIPPGTVVRKGTNSGQIAAETIICDDFVG